MENEIDNKKFAEICNKCRKAVADGEYKKAREFNNILYKDEFNEYLKLIFQKRELENSESTNSLKEQFNKLNNQILIKQSLNNLEKLLDSGLILINREIRGNQKWKQ